MREFAERGVLVARGVLTDDDLQPVIDEIAAWVDDRARDLHRQGTIDDLHTDEPFERRYGLLYAQSTGIGLAMDVMFMLGPAMFDLLRTPRLLDAVESLVGPEITCNPIQHLRAKPPERFEPSSGPSFHVVPWHQDAGVMMHEAESSNIVSCWLPLGDATAEMGCMRALPGVFRQGYLPHVSNGETMIDPDALPDVEPVTLECRKGDVVFVHRMTPHSSTPNRSDRCRWSLDLRYQTTGHHTGRTAHPAFVVRSASDPASVLADHAEWAERWHDAFGNPRGYAGHRQDVSRQESRARRR